MSFIIIAVGCVTGALMSIFSKRPVYKEDVVSKTL